MKFLLDNGAETLTSVFRSFDRKVANAVDQSRQSIQFRSVSELRSDDEKELDSG